MVVLTHAFAKLTRSLLLLVAALALAAPAVAQQSVILVRHADRQDDSADSPLSEAGRARAVKLATAFRDSGITTIFVTQWQRTQQTAAPLAEALGLTPVVVQSTDIDGLVKKLHAMAPLDAAMVVAHSDTLPKIVAALGVTEAVTVGADEFDNVFLVVPRAGQRPRLVRLKY